MRDFSTSLNEDQAKSHKKYKHSLRDKSEGNYDGDRAYQETKYQSAVNSQEGAKNIYQVNRTGTF